MSMTIDVTIIDLPAMQSGQGKNGAWFKQEVLVRTDGQYPKTIPMSAWKDTAKALSNQKPGTKITAHIDLDGREYNGKHYPEIKIWKFDIIGQAASGRTDTANDYAATVADDDLPF